MMARKKNKTLSEPQKRVLETLETYQERYGYPPSIREIQKEAKISSTSMVDYYLNRLVELGYIERDGKVSRGIRLVKTLSQKVGEMFQVPVIGRIQAGEPLNISPTDFSLFDPESMVEVATSLLPRQERDKPLYALEVQGDSMIDAMVNDGDIIILQPADEAHNGEMVAAWLKDEEATTLKYFYRENGTVQLKPANPHYEPIKKKVDDVLVQGKVVMVIRQVQESAI